jgi:hypothetical protein
MRRCPAKRIAFQDEIVAEVLEDRQLGSDQVSATVSKSAYSSTQQLIGYLGLAESPEIRHFPAKGGMNAE